MLVEPREAEPPQTPQPCEVPTNSLMDSGWKDQHSSVQKGPDQEGRSSSPFHIHSVDAKNTDLFAKYQSLQQNPTL